MAAKKQRKMPLPNRDRVKQFGEVFTPPKLVAEMLDKLDPTVFTVPSKTFCDPTCGAGNFLVAVVERKIHAGSSPLQALQTTYGIELQADNTAKCRYRLLKIAEAVSGQTMNGAWMLAVATNIVNANTLTYDMKFTPPWNGMLVVDDTAEQSRLAQPCRLISPGHF